MIKSFSTQKQQKTTQCLLKRNMKYDGTKVGPIIEAYQELKIQISL